MFSKMFFNRNLVYRTKNNKWTCFTRNYSVQSEDKIIKSPAPLVDLPKGNFAKTVFRDVDKHWKNIALECSQTGQKFTFAELIDQIARWSEFMRQIGISKNDTVTIIAPNCLQYTPILFGSISLGAAFSPINVKYTPDEIRKMVKSTKSKTIIFSKEIEETIMKALGEDLKNYQLFCIGKTKELKAIDVDDIIYKTDNTPSFKPTEIDGNEILYIPFSSGTTGPPKATLASHNALAGNVLMYTNPYHDVLWEPEGINQRVQIGMLPFFHIYGLLAVLSVGLFSGAKTVVYSNFSPETFINTIIKNKITHLHTVPTLLNLLNNSPNCSSETMSHINSVLCGAAPVLKASVDLLRKKIGKEIIFYEGFGMTEVGITNLRPKRFQRPIGCGHLLSNVEAKVISLETGAVLGPNETGEICIRTPSMMKGYLDNPSATNDFIRNGFAHTGDIGYYDNENFFYVVDRTKDLIKVQGMQVSPSEIEGELQKHPSVAECSIIGIPDDMTGEAPFAFVIPKQEVSENELHQFLKDKLSKYKQLRGGIKFVDALPKSDTGKVLRRQLRTMV